MISYHQRSIQLLFIVTGNTFLVLKLHIDQMVLQQPQFVIWVHQAVAQEAKLWLWLQVKLLQKFLEEEEMLLISYKLPLTMVKELNLVESEVIHSEILWQQAQELLDLQEELMAIFIIYMFT